MPASPMQTFQQVLNQRVYCYILAKVQGFVKIALNLWDIKSECHLCMYAMVVLGVILLPWYPEAVP